LTLSALASDILLVKPRCGGILGTGNKAVAWTGCGTSPATPACFRDTASFDVKVANQQYKAVTVGLPADRHLEVINSGTTGMHLTTWLNEIKRFLTNTGQHSVFLLQDKLGEERSLFSHSGCLL
jgi:hypothetical protein